MKPTPELIARHFTGCYTLVIALALVALGLVAAVLWPGWSPVNPILP